jgi:hypothetical protein
MTYAPSTTAPRNFAITENSAKARPGFFRWFFEAMVQSRQRQADREIARYLNNGKFTDEAEREIERRFLSTPSHF